MGVVGLVYGCARARVRVMFVSGTKAAIRAQRIALNKAGSVRGHTVGGPDFVPQELDADGLAAGWTSPCADEPLEAGTSAVLEVPDEYEHLLDGKDGRPALSSRKALDKLPAALRARIEERIAARAETLGAEDKRP
jgi:hypothetical protein